MVNNNDFFAVLIAYFDSLICSLRSKGRCLTKCNYKEEREKNQNQARNSNNKILCRFNDTFKHMGVKLLSEHVWKS